MQFSRPLSIALVLSSLLILGACEDASTKAERKYQSSVSLAAEGDPDRALVELRGVFDLQTDHLEARLLYADLQAEKGDMREAFGHYRIVTEQYPDNVRARIEVTKLLIGSGDWEQAERHLEAAVELDPDDAEVKSLLLAKDLRDAMEARDISGLDVLIERARALLLENQELEIARNVLVDSLIRQQDLYGAVEAIDEGLDLSPENRSWNEVKLRLLDQLGDSEAVGTQLKAMIDRFPDNQQYKLFLIQWYLGNDDVQSADDFMQSEIEKAGDATEPRIAYIQFLMQTKTPDDALAQINLFVEEGTNDDVFKMLRASTLYDMGEQEVAIAEMLELVVDQPATDTRRDQQITLARMYLGSGQPTLSNELVEDVLEQDAFHVEALKLRANDLIERDLVGDAILTLRTALDQAPQDAALRTLMAKAHEREGNRNLMGENLAIAVQNSGSNATESLRYARFLMSQEKYQSARDVVLQSLRRHPTNLQLLRVLSEIYVGLADWPRTEQVIAALRALNDPQAELLANGLEATILQRLQRTDESLTLLRGMLDNDSTALVAQAAIIRTHLANGDVEAARTFMDEVLSANPENDGTRFLNAALLSVEGDFDAANEIYRTLLSENPQQEVVWRAYVAGLNRIGKTDEALSALNESLSILPESVNLLWLKASYEERSGNYEGAITIYQDLYESESNSAIVANNLASLIASHRSSDEDLQLAYRIARRLKDTEIPAFQDTYGWIAYRLGRTDEALEYLEPAAKGLPNDPLVLEHYGKALLAFDRNDEAVAQFKSALALLSEDRKEDIDRLQNEISQVTSGAP